MRLIKRLLKKDSKNGNLGIVCEAYDGVSTMNFSLRHSGKEFIKKDKECVTMYKDKIVINKSVLDKFGIELVIIETD